MTTKSEGRATPYIVAITPKGALREVLSTTGDRDYADWLAPRLIARGEVQPTDIIKEVTPEEYERLCDDARYRRACLKAAKTEGRAA